MLALRVCQQASSTALLRAHNPGSATSPGVEFYTLQACLLDTLFSRSRPDNANNIAKPHSCFCWRPLPVQGAVSSIQLLKLSGNLPGKTPL